MKSTISKVSAMVLLCGLVGVAQSEIVVVVGPSADSLSKEELVNLYLARSFDRKLIDLPEGGEVRNTFYKSLTDREPSQIKAIWARTVFSGKGQPPLVLSDPIAVKKAVTSDPKAVGYMEKSQVDGSVKVLLTLQ